MESQAYLRLGWEVNRDGHPDYWLREAKPKAGEQSDRDLVRVPAEDMAAHTVIVAQSGSGKSFFLGRLIEELLLRTQARCLILDPNADFWQVQDVASADLWKGASYDSQRRRGKLPDESRRPEFNVPWKRVTKRIRTARFPEPRRPYERLQIWWPDLSVETFAEDLDPIQTGALYHCHSFVQAIAPLVQLKGIAQPRNKPDLIETAEQLYDGKSQIETLLANQFPLDQLTNAMLKTAAKAVLSDELTLAQSAETGSPKERNSRFISRRMQEARAALQYTPEDIGKYYFGKAKEYKTAQILASEPAPGREQDRLDVIDISSLPDRATRLLATNMVLARAWKRARTSWLEAFDKEKDDRVPTFIVIDEAHNLVPSEPRREAERALREQIRTVAAEGRKFGLFLILVSQRPDKLDPLVVSECENKAVMRLDSHAVLDEVRRIFGLDDFAKAEVAKSLGFGKGRVLFLGRWAGEYPKQAYAAARRTVEGGRNLRDEHWARPHDGVRQASRSDRVPPQPKPPSVAKSNGGERRSSDSTVGSPKPP